MQTIMELENKLKLAKAAASEKIEGALFQTGIIIDLDSPEGNVFHIMGICARLFDQLGLSHDEYKKYFNECRNGYYKDILEISRRWFVFIYLNEHANHKKGTKHEA